MPENYIVKSPFKNELEQSGDFYQYIENVFQEYPDTVAMHDVFTDASVTFKEAGELIDTIAQNLYQRYDFRPGDYFAVYSPNTIEYLLVTLAVWKLRGIHVGINPLLKPDEVRRELDLVDCKLLLAHPFTAANAVQAVAGTQVKDIFIKGECEEQSVIDYSNLVEKPAKIVPLPSTPSAPGDVCAVLFSSGTTGLPKGVDITHIGLKNVLYASGDRIFHGDCPHRVVYQPLSHIYGLGISMMGFHVGSTLHIMARFNLQVYLKCIVENKVNNLTLVPPIAVLLVKTKLDPSLDLSCVDTVYNGAAPMSQEVVDALNEKLGGHIYFRQFYGLTETGLAISTPKKDCDVGGDRVPAGSIGMPVPGCEVKVRSLKDASTLGPGERGELCMRGTNIMKGYAKNPQATRDAFDEDGWFRSGDIGYVDENGYVFVVDRLKELVKYKGYQVAPAELESLLLTHEAVADSGVFGVPNLEAGELPYAWVVLKPEASLTEEEIQEWVAERVAPFKKLRGGIKFAEAIPKSLAGKILRREMKRITLEELKN